MRAADLGYDAKQQLLGALRNQLGQSKYDELRSMRNDDEIIDMVLQAGEHYARAEQRKEIEASSQVTLFWMAWVIISVIVGAIWGSATGWLFFCSPGWWFMVGGATPVVPYRRYWVAFVISLLMLIGFFAMFDKLGDKRAFVTFVASSLIGLATIWISGKIAEQR